MSTPKPSRRRIAGERRRPESDGAATTTDDAQSPAVASTTAPPKAPKQPRPPRASRAPRGPGSWRVFSLALVLALATVATALWLGLKTWDYGAVRADEAEKRAGSAASASAERAAAAVLSYKYDTLDADLKKASGFLTPAFRKTFTDTFNTYVKPNAPELEATVTAKVLSSAVVTAGENRAEILVFVDQTSLTKANEGEPQLALNRTTFSMVKRGGSWLVDGFTSY